MPENTHDLPNQSLPVANSAPNDTGRVDESERDAPAGSHDAKLDTPPGYELLGEIGRGGMGVVFRARDTRLKRDVAVKMLQGRYAPNSFTARRFLDEAHITGELQHPGIPPIHELGVLPDGRPFLAMKLIKGRTLADTLESRSANRGSLIAAFEQVCQAVAYAHDHGVIHRDLKPANVMMGAFGEVQVMDWGLAKFRTDARAETVETSTATTFHDPRREEDKDLRTRTGSFLGTPAYMSPEQAIGAVDRIDERSDVFGLGAVLCVILTGHPPFVGATAETTRQLAAEKKLDDAIARLDASAAEPELVALCKRCLAPEREDRPRNAGEVAAAVHALRVEAEKRARCAEVERARAEVHAGEQRKRRKVQLLLAGAVLLLLTGGGAFAWWNQRTRTEQAEIESAKLRAEAEAEGQHQAVRDRIISGRVATTALLEQVEKALGDGDTGRAATPSAEAARRIGEGGLDEFRPRLERCYGEFDMLKELDAIDNDRLTSADGKFPNWDTIAPRLARAFSGYGITPETTLPAEAARRINDSFIRERLLTSLEVWFVETRDANLRAILSAADPDAFRDEARATNYQRALFARAFRGQPLPVVQQVWFAIAHGADRGVSRGVREHLMLTAHRSKPSHFPLLMALGRSGGFGDRESAERSAGWFRAALALQPKNAAAWCSLGVALEIKGDPHGAIAAHREAVRLDPKLAEAHDGLGAALRAKGDQNGAIAAHREAIRLNPKRATAHYNLGIALSDKGDLDGAFAAYREAVLLDPKYAKAHYNLGNALYRRKDLDGAIASYKEAIRHDPELALAHNNLGVALRAKGNLVGAIAGHREAIRLDPKYATAHNNLGIALHDKKDLDGAIAAYKEAIRLEPKDAHPHNNLGVSLRDKGELDGAIAEYREAIRLDTKLVQAHYNLAAVYLKEKKYPEAIACARATIAVDPKFSTAHAMLGELLQRTGDIPGARAALTEAIRLDKRWAWMLAELPPLDLAPPPRVKHP